MQHVRRGCQLIVGYEASIGNARFFAGGAATQSARSSAPPKRCPTSTSRNGRCGRRFNSARKASIRLRWFLRGSMELTHSAISGLPAGGGGGNAVARG